MKSFCLLLPIKWRQDCFCKIHVDNTHGVHTADQESILTFGFPRFGKINHILPTWLIFYLQPFPEVGNDIFCFHFLLEVKMVVHGSNELNPSWIKCHWTPSNSLHIPCLFSLNSLNSWELSQTVFACLCLNGLLPPPPPPSTREILSFFQDQTVSLPPESCPPPEKSPSHLGCFAVL